jgi:maltose O-acetyltransferase
MDEFLDAARVGRVIIRESSHLGARCIVLPGVEIGPRTIVGAGSIISKSLPPDTVCGGNPAKVICSLDEYLAKHRQRIESRPTFDYLKYDIRYATAERKAQLVVATIEQDVYIVGGRTAEEQGLGATPRVE